MQIGYHAVFDPGFLDAIHWAADHGFGYVQFDLNVPRFYLDGVTDAELRRIRAEAEDRGVGLSLHAPGDNVSLFTDFPAIRSGILEQFSRILEAAGVLGARHLTIHPGSPPSFRKAGETGEGWRQEHRVYYGSMLRENLLRLAERAGSVLLTVENSGLVSTAFDVVEPLLGGGSPLCLCWDLAKSQAQPEAASFYRRNLQHLREVHVHDLDGQGREHQGVGEGVLPWDRYLDVLRLPEVALTIEVRPREEALRSKARLERMLAS